MRVSRLHRLVSVALIVPFLAVTTQTASGQLMPASGQAAQQPAGQASRDSQGKETMAAGMLEGEMLAESHHTGGKVALGVGIGVLTGLIGTAIGYAVTGPAPMSPEALQRYSNKSPDYQLGFKTAWDKKTKSKKRNSFLVGGLLGTAAFVAVLVSAQGRNQ